MFGIDGLKKTTKKQNKTGQSGQQEGNILVFLQISPGTQDRGFKNGTVPANTFHTPLS